MYLRKGQKLKLVTGQIATVVKDGFDYFVCEINGALYSARKSEIGKTAFYLDEGIKQHKEKPRKKQSGKPPARYPIQSSEKRETYFTGIEYIDPSKYNTSPVNPHPSGSSSKGVRRRSDYRPHSMEPPKFAEGTPRMRYRRYYKHK